MMTQNNENMSFEEKMKYMKENWDETFGESYY